MVKCEKYLHLFSGTYEYIPVHTYMEIDNNRQQHKIVEIFKDGHVDYADDVSEHGTFLADGRYPEPREINGVNGYEGLYLEYISKEDFYHVWDKYTQKIDN